MKPIGKLNFKPSKAEDFRSNTPQGLGEGINKLLKDFRIEGKFRETQIINTWEAVMGPSVARRTTRIFITDRTLYVELNSPPLKHQLNLSRSLIVQRINENVKSEVLTEVVFL